MTDAPRTSRSCASRTECRSMPPCPSEVATNRMRSAFTRDGTPRAFGEKRMEFNLGLTTAFANGPLRLPSQDYTRSILDQR